MRLHIFSPFLSQKILVYSSLDLKESPDAFNSALRISHKCLVTDFHKKCLKQMKRCFQHNYHSSKFKPTQMDYGSCKMLTSVIQVNALWLPPAGFLNLFHPFPDEFRYLNLPAELLTKYHRGRLAMAREIPKFIAGRLSIDDAVKDCCEDQWEELLGRLPETIL